MAGDAENLKTRLAIAVRSIQWSYAIFWSVSAAQPGVLVWGDGYYNGDIKTRKTIQAVELKADQLGLQRSEQLRELYESLLVGEPSGGSQTRRSSAALSPEDLTDTEWYYLVCMSFVFTIDEGMPGRTLTSGEAIWLCNAHTADSKVFSRSLLAKSASVQTVVCFPSFGGVIEIGTTEVVAEDMSLIQCIKTSFLNAPYIIPSPQPDSISQHVLDPQVQHQESRLDCSDRISEDIGAEQEQEDSFMIEEINGGASQVQSWQFMDEEFSNCVHNSLNSSDCISQTFAEPLKFAANKNRSNYNSVERTTRRVQEIQEHNRKKLTSLDLRRNDLHYQSVLSALFKTNHQLILGVNAQDSSSRKTSSFLTWKKPSSLIIQELRNVTSQRMLKKVLFEVPKMYENELSGSPEENGISDGGLRPEGEETTNHVLSERKRREKLNERFMILRSIVPSISKADKISILDETIEYLQELERRVEELESCKEPTETEPKPNKKTNDASERTSTCSEKQRLIASKRKACDIDDNEPESTDFVMRRDDPVENLTIRSYGQDVVIDIQCLWREGILLEIMDTVCGLNLDSHSVQSSTCDGILSLTVNCKHKGSKVATAGMIREALQRVAWNR